MLGYVQVRCNLVGSSVAYSKITSLSLGVALYSTSATIGPVKQEEGLATVSNAGVAVAINCAKAVGPFTLNGSRPTIAKYFAVRVYGQVFEASI